jgi:hypothetical protein
MKIIISLSITVQNLTLLNYYFIFIIIIIDFKNQELIQI